MIQGLVNLGLVNQGSVKIGPVNLDSRSGKLYRFDYTYHILFPLHRQEDQCPASFLQGPINRPAPSVYRVFQFVGGRI